jgi:kumamolisin
MPASQPKAEHVPLKGSRRYHRPGAEVLGRCDQMEWCEVTVKVHRKAPLPEPVPGKALSRADLTAKYGADSKDLDAVEKALSPFGLTVLSKNLAARTVKLAGAASKMERAFGVNLLRVKHNDVVYRGRVGEIQIPAQLSKIVTGVFGLDNRPMIKRRTPIRSQAVGALPPPGHRPWFLPQELADAYKFPPGDGSGQKVGILEFGGKYIPADLQLFLKAAGLPSATPEVVVKHVLALPADQQNDADSIGETMLDIEVVAGLCPKATISVYFSRWSEKGWVDNLDAVLTDDDAPPILSVSYGLAEGESIWTKQTIDHVNDTLKELANAGMTVCVSTGDDGSDDQVNDGQAHVSFPASSPYVLAVGGTALDRSTGDEIVWFEGDGVRRDQGGATGGGVSEFNPKPTWQTVDIPSVDPSVTSGRIIPDVAADAAGSTGYFMIAQGTPQIVGGTSAATPLWAGLLTRIIQAGKKVGFLTPRLYGPTSSTGGKPLGHAACRDITSGSNKSGSAAAGFSAMVGYDACTGWGSPNGKALLENLP